MKVSEISFLLLGICAGVMQTLRAKLISEECIVWQNRIEATHARHSASVATTHNYLTTVLSVGAGDSRITGSHLSVCGGA